ncbi:hypothetical protein N9L92_03150 [Saprospiraceae bacterium]|nr:hypothetical protein [Saprospiraceae bacterium]
MNFKTLLKISILAAFIFTFQSCGDDDVVGCMDPAAENFDADANVSGDCTFARDKFLGSYLGVFTCPGDLSLLSNDSIQFSIIEGLDPDIKSDIILELIVDGFPLAIAGKVEGDVLTLMQELTGVPIPTPLGEFPGDVTAVGMAMVSNGNQTLTATLDLDVIIQSPIGGSLDVADMCGITGDRQ